jgi:hypothetical protein
MSKRILVISDLHCGHRAGLTPPNWQDTNKDSGTRTKCPKLASLQSEAWTWYVKNVTRHGPYDMVVCNGDAIDGRGERSGGTELISADRYDQCTIAETCIKRAMTKGTKLLMTYGTPYHTGDQEDWEGLIATDLNAIKIGAHEWLEYGGLVFDFKHHIGGSATPYTRGNSVSKDSLWNRLWAEAGLQPKSDILVRSHVHHRVCIDDPDLGLRLTTAALQTMGSKYGARRCSGTVHFGFEVFDIDRNGLVRHEFVQAHLQHEVAKAVKL